MKHDPFTPNENRERRSATAHDMLDNEGAPVRNDGMQKRPSHAVTSTLADREHLQLDPANGSAVVDVIRRLRRGRWTLTEVYR